MLALLPRQLMESPTANFASLMVLVELTFESFIDVHNMLKASRKQCFARFMRALTTATYQYDRCATFVIRADNAAKKEFAHFGDELWVNIPVRLINLGYLYGAFWVADEQELHG